jgi:hypothetical protein
VRFTRVGIVASSLALAASGLGAVAVTAATPAKADTIISGSTGTPVGTCGYSVDTDSTDYTSIVGYTATLTCSTWLKITATGSIDAEQVNLDAVTIKTPVQDLDLTPDLTVVVPVDPTTVADIHTFWNAAVSGISGEAADLLAQNVVPAAADSAEQATQAFGFDSVLSSLNSTFCDQLGIDQADKVCDKVVGAQPHDTSAGGIGGDQGLDEASACPPLAIDPPKNYFVVCMPTIVAGDASTSKNLILVPGGALLTLPITGNFTSPLGPPTIHSGGSIIALGAAIGGAGVNLTASKDIDLAGSAIGALGPVTLQAGGKVDIGAFSIGSALSFIASLFSGSGDSNAHPNDGDLADAVTGDNPGPDPSLLDSAVKKAVSLVNSLSATIPAIVDAPSVKITAPSATVETGSVVSVDGFGGNGESFDGLVPAEGGATDNYGGSHAGLGGYPIDASFTGAYLGNGGRGKISGNPFNPVDVGGGGGGSADDASGLNGGGTIAGSVSGTFTLNGTLSADGDDPGWAAENGDHGGGGAGGSINLTVGTLTGTGTAHANGGSFCATCLNGGGGLGGGGMVAASYATSTFKGSLHALGGVDVTYPKGTLDTADLDAPGGAGTVFTVQRTIKGKKAPAWPDGILRIDGRGATTFPPADGTPIPVGWSDPKRALVVTNGARAYASTLKFGAVTVQFGSAITTAPGTHALNITTTTLTVDSSSRVDVSDHGYAGGKASDSAHDGAGGAPKGVRAATGGYGGSHGGAGGSTLQPSKGDHSGATYDSALHPTLPGGGGSGVGDADGLPGGGVIIVHAATLTLLGVIAANGASTEGPTKTDPTPWDSDAGAGAGGAINVTATTLTGTGVFEANGGTACMKTSALLPGSDPCGGFAGGGGGGGRVAVYAQHRTKWKGKLLAAGGPNFSVEVTKAMQGKPGSVHLAA